MNHPMRLAAAVALALGATFGGSGTAAADPPRWAPAHGWHQKHHPPAYAHRGYRAYPPPTYYAPPRAYYGPPLVYGPPAVYRPAPWPPVIVIGATFW